MSTSPSSSTSDVVAPSGNGSISVAEPAHGDDAPTPDVGQTRRRAGQTILQGLLLGLAPVIVAWWYGVERFFQLSGADPFIYTGYTFSTADLISRWGYPYYAVRFGLIIPSNLFAEAFGIRLGYLSLRWVVTMVAIGTAYALLRRLYRWEVGALAVVLILSSPIFVRAVMTVYATTVGVPAIAGAFALLLLPTTARTSRLTRLAAGLLIGLACNANVFAVLPAAAVLATWFCCRATADRRDALRGVVPIAAGVAAVTLVGAIAYGLQFGDPNILTPSLSAADRLSTGVSPDKELSRAWLNFRPDIWLAPFATALLVISLKRLRRAVRWFEWAIAFAPAVMWSGYAVHTFVLGSNTLEIYFYSSYMIGPILIAIATTIGIVIESSSTRHRRQLLISATVLVAVAPMAWTHFGRPLAFWSLNGFLPLALLAFLAAWSVRRFPLLSTLVMVVACLLPVATTLAAPRNVPQAAGQRPRQDPQYDAAFFRYDDISLDLYALAAEFSASMPRTNADAGSLVFWVAPDDYMASLMQWTYLGPFSSISSPSSSPMPTLDAEAVDRLRLRTPRFIVVMASSESVRDQGTAAIDALGLPVVDQIGRTYQEGPYELYVTRVELRPDSCDEDHEGETRFWDSLPLCDASD